MNKKLCIIIFACLVKIGYYGFQYFPQLDDYIQYGLFSQFNHPFTQVYLRMGLYNSRPLAGIFDIFLWSKFWENMWIPFVIITVISAITCYILIVIFEKININFGMIFVTIFLLNPISFEGTYWISASTRIVIGMFFATLSIWYFQKNKIPLFAILQLISFCFYEQVIIYSLILCLFTLPKKYAFIPLANLLIISVYYLVFMKMGNQGYRGELSIKSNLIYELLDGLNSYSLFSASFIKGLESGFYILIIVGVAVAFLGFETSVKNHKKLVIGVLMAVAPFLIFIILGNVGLSYRNFLIPLIGVGMIFDWAFDFLGDGKGIATIIVTAAFLICCSGELAFYKENYELDQQIISNIDYKKTVRQQRYTVLTGKNYGEHILSILSSDWAITGALRERFHDPYLPMVNVSALY